MSGLLRISFLVGVLLVVGVLQTDASAQGLGCGLGGGGYGLGFFNYGYGQGIDTPRLPYYALYPPVYYSYPVPRTYGYSPFAYPPGTMTPEVIQPAQAAPVIYNPYVPKREPISGPGKDKSAAVTPK